MQEGLSVLMAACMRGHLGVIRALLTGKANLNITDKVEV